MWPALSLYKLAAWCVQSMKSDDLRERLEESEKLMNEMERTWEDKLKETERIHMVISLTLYLGICHIYVFKNFY